MVGLKNGVVVLVGVFIVGLLIYILFFRTSEQRGKFKKFTKIKKSDKNEEGEQ